MLKIPFWWNRNTLRALQSVRMEEVDGDQDKIKHRAKPSANSEHPAHSPTPCKCKSLPERWLLPKQEDPVSALGIVGQKPTELCHSSGEEESERVSNGDVHGMILIKVPESPISVRSPTRLYSRSPRRNQ